jgi:hypothetical protein
MTNLSVQHRFHMDAMASFFFQLGRTQFGIERLDSLCQGKIFIQKYCDALKPVTYYHE